MEKARIAVRAEKLGTLKTLLVNTIAALIVEFVFIAIAIPPFKRVWVVNGLSQDGYHRLFVTVILVAIIITAFSTVLTEQLMERTLMREGADPFGLELNRAMYFAVVGIVCVGLARAAVEGRILVAFGMAMLVAILLYFGRAHKKFQEARAGGTWFPHTAFHFILQQFVLFPIGLSVILQILKRIG